MQAVQLPNGRFASHIQYSDATCSSVGRYYANMSYCNADDRDSDCDGNTGRLGESGAILRDSPRIGLDFRCRSTYL